MCDMKSKILFLLPVVGALYAAPAPANWQYDGTYIGDGWYNDDGARFVISVRGGMSFGSAKIQNDVGALTTWYYYNPSSGDVMTGLAYARSGGESALPGFEAVPSELGDMSVSKNFSETAFAAGASVGWALPNHPQWRLELGWDHIGETDYNASPLFEGTLVLPDGKSLPIQSGGAQSTITTDIVSAMAFYDFFDGLQKPLQTVIPYVGFGVGYADSKTVLNLSDLYGDLSVSEDLTNFGQQESADSTIQFYRSEHSSSNIAGVVAAGVSYGITQTMFLDFGARVAYVPRVKWVLTNSDDTRTRDWYSAKNLIYANIMLGLRFEF